MIFQEAKKPIFCFNRNSKPAMGYNSSAQHRLRITKRGFPLSIKQIEFHMRVDCQKKQENKLQTINSNARAASEATISSAFYTCFFLDFLSTLAAHSLLSCAGESNSNVPYAVLHVPFYGLASKFPPIPTENALAHKAGSLLLRKL